MSDDLVAFLRARLDEDERVAREAAISVGDTGYERGELVRAPAQHGEVLVSDGQHWVGSYHRVVREQSRGPHRPVVEAAAFGGRRVAEHIARHDPARVLAEVEAKRRIVQRHAECGSGGGYCDDGGHGWDHLPGGGCAELADLASVYADRAGYREEWRP